MLPNKSEWMKARLNRRTYNPPRLESLQLLKSLAALTLFFPRPKFPRENTLDGLARDLRHTG